MARPSYPSRDVALRQLKGFLESAAICLRDIEASGVGALADKLFESVIAVDDLYAFDKRDSRFTAAREILERWSTQGR